MLKTETSPVADHIGAVVPNPGGSAGTPSTATAQGARASDGPNELAHPSRFVSGARAILLLSLACWAALIGAALLLFG